MPTTRSLQNYLINYRFNEGNNLALFDDGKKTTLETVDLLETKVRKFTNEFWTAKQRQASSLHEISYRACFKPQLPRFFIELLTEKGDVIYDPFSGRGTSIIEAALLNRRIVSNDINPISKILSFPRLFVPSMREIIERLDQLNLKKVIKKNNDLDLSMFYHPNTEKELLALREYLNNKTEESSNDNIDDWIRMIATNRLSGHSSGFFSVYTLPPNQAVSQESQRKINQKRNQKPSPRDVKNIIIKKSVSLISNLSKNDAKTLHKIGEDAKFLESDAGNTPEILSDTVKLVVTSPPFLDVVQYSDDNWLRCWFNAIDTKEIEKKITMSKNIGDWSKVMSRVFDELFRIVKYGGHVAFEVGEVKNGKINLEDHVIPLGLQSGFQVEGIMINAQDFTKTSNIWGIRNNSKGTNTNRIVLFSKL